MQERVTLPPIQAHTEAKHDILRRHVDGWFPILGRSSSGPLQYIDGFAGPGEYEDGEPGSPIIAMQGIQSHSYAEEFNKASKRFHFLFVEKDYQFVNYLRNKVSETLWPDIFDIRIEHSEFEPILVQLLDEVESGSRTMPPTLLFIDPFGSAGFSMQVLARLSRHSRIDVLINFNYLDLNHWILPDQVKHGTLDRLYGGNRWRPAIEMIGDDRKEFLIREYGLALQDAGWRSTNFEMINNHNQTQYYLVFATRHQRGMQVIKAAMRSVSPDGLYRYADRTNPAQLRFIGLGMDEEYAAELAEHLHVRYRGTAVPKEELIDIDVAWHPRWNERDLTASLRLLESASPPRILDVRNSDGRPRKRNSYPAGCVITFSA